MESEKALAIEICNAFVAYLRGILDRNPNPTPRHAAQRIQLAEGGSIASGTTERLTTDPMTSLSEWTRDGRAVAYRSAAGVRLQAWPRSGGSSPIASSKGSSR